MELLLVNTSHGLTPCYDEDYDEKKKLKLGQTYKAKITVPRNVSFHRKYFALINCAWEYQNEKMRTFFHDSKECFRKSVEVSAGHCDKVYNIGQSEWYDIPKSVAFDKMDETEFEELYNSVYHVLFTVFLNNITEEEFKRNLINF